jgi:hypothetical protein
MTLIQVVIKNLGPKIILKKDCHNLIRKQNKFLLQMSFLDSLNANSLQLLLIIPFLVKYYFVSKFN